jgi:hypothetical protein
VSGKPNIAPLRTLTEYELTKTRATNIATLAAELQEIAEIALQDGRSIRGKFEFTNDVELADIEYRFTRYVESLSASLGLQAV